MSAQVQRFRGGTAAFGIFGGTKFCRILKAS
jgi:hypothetical protein